MFPATHRFFLALSVTALSLLCAHQPAPSIGIPQNLDQLWAGFPEQDRTTPLRTATTRKLNGPKWRGPDNATLSLEVRCESDNQLVLNITTNGHAPEC